MIEGQEGVSWDEWVALARACEENGLDGLFRSDHYQSVFDQTGRGSLDAWATLVGARGGDGTDPARARWSRRRPSAGRRCSRGWSRPPTTSRAGASSSGSARGWNVREHEAHGFPFPDLGERMEILEEQLEIVHRQWTEEEFSFEGRHYRLERCRAEPKPLQKPHPPIVMGGGAGPRVARLAARWADEYNIAVLLGRGVPRPAVPGSPQACEREGREPIPFSLMSACCVGRDRPRRSSVPANRLRADGLGRRPGGVPRRRRQADRHGR